MIRVFWYGGWRRMENPSRAQISTGTSRSNAFLASFRLAATRA